MTVPAVQNVPKPTHSPWGTVQRASEVVPGVWSVSTAGHGGLFIAPELNAQIPEHVRDAQGWYEEDEQWCVPWVLLGLPPRPYWAPGTDPARDALKHHLPDLYEAHYGVTLQPGESLTRDRETFLAAHQQDFIVWSALGAHAHPNIAPGTCGVIASRGGVGTPTEERRYFLISAERYAALQQAQRFGCVVTDEFTPASPEFLALTEITHLS
ncbi:DUF7007 domain-containing protein [Deinococcus ficus]|uniref:DUF7007 domain-containing protein n=1 Tax=Deinococcus ficus TaxID=317577 RepID=A0A221T2U2_9DEIO|nr:hypothetical protein [Deinococcus ficus]ASN83209.1 hypothetical protein DFI_18595 [Deinococcus ficus]